MERFTLQWTTMSSTFTNISTKVITWTSGNPLSPCKDCIQTLQEVVVPLTKQTRYARPNSTKTPRLSSQSLSLRTTLADTPAPLQSVCILDLHSITTINHRGRPRFSTWLHRIGIITMLLPRLQKRTYSIFSLHNLEHLPLPSITCHRIPWSYLLTIASTTTTAQPRRYRTLLIGTSIKIESRTRTRLFIIYDSFSTLYKHHLTH